MAIQANSISHFPGEQVFRQSNLFRLERALESHQEGQSVIRNALKVIGDELNRARAGICEAKPLQIPPHVKALEMSINRAVVALCEALRDSLKASKASEDSLVLHTHHEAPNCLLVCDVDEAEGSEERLIQHVLKLNDVVLKRVEAFGESVDELKRQAEGVDELKRQAEGVDA